MQTGVVFLCWPPRLCNSALLFVIFFIYVSDFLKQAESLHRELDLTERGLLFIHSFMFAGKGERLAKLICEMQNTTGKFKWTVAYVLWPGKADRHLCEVILNELKQAVSKTTGDPIRQVLFFIVTGNPTGHLFFYLGLGRRLDSLSLKGHGFCLKIGRWGQSLPGAFPLPPWSTTIT